MAVFINKYDGNNDDSWAGEKTDATLIYKVPTQFTSINILLLACQ